MTTFLRRTSIGAAIATAVTTIALSAGWCGTAGAAPDQPEQMQFGGLTRTYIVHLPSGSQHPSALVLNLHGRGGTGRKLEQFTHYDAVADANGFAVVYPDGIDNSWADGRGSSAADGRGIDDVGFLTTLATTLAHNYGIDPGHVFATGMSNGALMTQRLACERADVFAAIAPVAGTLNADVACTPSRPVAELEMHGTADRTVPFDGGVVRGPAGPSTVLGAAATAARWRQIDGCQGDPTQDTLAANGPRVQRFTVSGCAGGTAVELIQIDGGGHVWPDGTPGHGPDAAEVTWQFLAGHARATGT